FPAAANAAILSRNADASGPAVMRPSIVTMVTPSRSCCCMCSDMDVDQTGILMPVIASTSSIGTISIASHGHPSRNAPSGPLLVHFLQPIQSTGSTSMWPKGGWSSSGTQYMQSPTGQYGTHAGDPAQPVQHSVMTASSLGRFLRGVMIPSDLGSILTTSVDMERIMTQDRAKCHSCRGGTPVGRDGHRPGARSCR